MKKFLFFILLTISSIAHANWNLTFTSTDGDKFYIDYSTINRQNNIAKVWVRVDFGDGVEGSIRSTRSYNEYDCIQKKYRRLTTTYFKKPNLEQLVTTENKPTEYSYIAPNTVASGIIEIVCKK